MTQLLMDVNGRLAMTRAEHTPRTFIRTKQSPGYGRRVTGSRGADCAHIGAGGTPKSVRPRARKRAQNF